MRQLKAFITKDNLHKVSIKIPNPFGLTEKDLKGDIEDFPMGVVVRMMEEQEKQGNKPDVKVFQRNNCASKEQKGFSWDDAINTDIWGETIMLHDFDTFFDKYPEYKRYNV